MSALLTSNVTGAAYKNPQFYIAYASHIAPSYLFVKSAFTDIRDEANRHNQAAGITGFLFFKKGKFFQYIEGTDSEIQALYQKICQDPRNKHNQILVQGHREERLFPEWSMHCFEITHEDDSDTISEPLGSFDVMRWNEETTLKVVNDVKSFYQNSHVQLKQLYQPRPNSYLSEWIASIKRQHLVFILLQLGFLALAVVAIGYYTLLG